MTRLLEYSGHNGITRVSLALMVRDCCIYEGGRGNFWEGAAVEEGKGWTKAVIAECISARQLIQDVHVHIL